MIVELNCGHSSLQKIFYKNLGFIGWYCTKCMQLREIIEVK